MVKAQLIEELQARAKLATKAESERIVNHFADIIAEALVKDGEVKIAGFGIFRLRNRAARQGRNPKTGETVQIAASKKVKFTAAKAFKEAVA